MTAIRSVRSQVADLTRAAHERLHHHPIIGQLASPDLTLRDYTIVLRSFQSVYSAVEKERDRRSHWPALTLSNHCRRLDQDCYAHERLPIQITLVSLSEMLGALYALHGAQFGASVIRRNLQRALPDAPRAHFDQCADHATWRLLLDCMEGAPIGDAAVNAVANGANRVFELIAKTAQDATENCARQMT